MARPSSSARPDPSGEEGTVARARWTLLEGVGADIAAAFPGITRLGGQIVAALYLSDGPRSMDQLAAELGCSKSNIFGNLRGLEGAGIVGRRREAGSRHDRYALRGPYPDVVIGAYMTRLRLVVADKRALSERAIRMLGDAEGADAELLRARLAELDRKYSLFADVLSVLLPAMEGPIDLERLLRAAPAGLVETIAGMVQDVLSGGALSGGIPGANRHPTIAPSVAASLAPTVLPPPSFVPARGNAAISAPIPASIPEARAQVPAARSEARSQQTGSVRTRERGNVRSKVERTDDRG